MIFDSAGALSSLHGKPEEALKLEALINDQGERPLLMKELLACLLSCEGGKKHLHALKECVVPVETKWICLYNRKTSATP